MNLISREITIKGENTGRKSKSHKFLKMSPKESKKV
jgi:hypothetical protein